MVLSSPVWAAPKFFQPSLSSADPPLSQPLNPLSGAQSSTLRPTPAISSTQNSSAVDRGCPQSTIPVPTLWDSRLYNLCQQLTVTVPSSKTFNTEMPLGQVPGFKSDFVRSPRNYTAASLTDAFPVQLVTTPLHSLDHQSPDHTDWLPFQSREMIAQSAVDDPELGILRLQSVPGLVAPTQTNPDTTGQNAPTTLRVCEDGQPPDPELGCVRLKPPPPAKPARQPVVYLLARFDYFRSSNIYSAIDPVIDGLARPGLTLYAAPRLGPNTFLTASITGNLIRYSTQTQISYNELQFEASIFQVLSPTMFGRIGWTNQHLYIASDDILGLRRGSQFLDDHAIRLELSRRDRFNDRLSLNTFYQLRVGFANPSDRSRIINSFIASLNYDIFPNVLQVGLDYQFALATFTQQSREDQFQQVGAHLSYTVFRNTQIYLFAGYSYGRSSDPLIDFDGLVLGVSLSTSLELF